MATTWSGSVELTNGQVAVAETTVVASDDGGFYLTLTTDTPALDRLCIWDGDRFICENDSHDYLISAQNLNLYPEVRSYRVKVTFSAVETATTTAQWNITSGNASLESSSLTAE